MKKNLNISDARKRYLSGIKKDKTTTVIFQVLLLIAFIGIWELLAVIGVIDVFFISCPSRIFLTLIDLFKTGSIFMHIGTTLYETIVGFLIATILGSLIAVLLCWSEKLRNILSPYIVVLNSLPKIALGPIIILWVGAGAGAIITMCVLICIVITTLSMLTSFLACDKDKILLMRSMKASKYQIFTKLILPNSIPDFVSVLKINVGMSWVGSIMGEYLVSKAGLGYLIVYGKQVFKLDLVMASIVLICILAGLMYYLVGLVEKRIGRK